MGGVKKRSICSLISFGVQIVPSKFSARPPNGEDKMMPAHCWGYLRQAVLIFCFGHRFTISQKLDGKNK
uniref:Uncharacterized protein n=1 Tax=Anopheles quadriannulatus TaxID=34691 RepID=A0A182XTX4_ANOQN